VNVSVCVATYGDPEWAELARRRAVPSARVAQARIGRAGGAGVYRMHVPGGTLAQARNQIGEFAEGDWLCFLDADDELEPGYLAAMGRAWASLALADRLLGAEVATESGPRPTRLGELAGPALLVPAVQYVDEDGGETAAEIPAWGRPLHEINCAVVGTLVPRDLFLAVGGFPEEPIYEDWALWLACVRAGAELVPVPDAVYRAWRRPASRNLGATAGEVYWRRRREHEAWLAGRA